MAGNQRLAYKRMGSEHECICFPDPFERDLFRARFRYTGLTREDRVFGRTLPVRRPYQARSKQCGTDCRFRICTRFLDMEGRKSEWRNFPCPREIRQHERPGQDSGPGQVAGLPGPERAGPGLCSREHPGNRDAHVIVPRSHPGEPGGNSIRSQSERNLGNARAGRLTYS